MKKLLFLFLILPAILFLSLKADYTAYKKPAKVLVFSKTAGYRHKSIGDGIKAIQKLAKENNFIVDTTESALKFNTENLNGYNAIIFLNPTGEVFNDDQKAAFKGYIQKGGGFVGVHAAADCLYKWEWYGKMLGAYFESHPAIQEAVLSVVNTKHLSTKDLISPWKHEDEWYNYKYINPDVTILLKLDEKSYKGGKNGDYHPIAWFHEYEGGRIFYTGLGHTSESYTSDKYFLQHLLGGIKYAAKIK